MDKDVILTNWLFQARVNNVRDEKFLLAKEARTSKGNRRRINETLICNKFNARKALNYQNGNWLGQQASKSKQHMSPLTINS